MDAQKAETFWDDFSGKFDVFSRYSEWRWRQAKKELFANAYGEVIMVGAGTGNDFPYFPSNISITAIDFSEKMLERARKKGPPSNVELKREDVQSLSFEDEAFDSAITSCVFCSVPDPVQGLKEVYRVLKPGGDIFMFEHTTSKNPVFSTMLKIMNNLPGPDLTRSTVKNVQLAGFDVITVEYLFLDVVKTIHARKPHQTAP